jgi:hypothetical protein
MDDASLRLAAWVQAAWVTGVHRTRTRPARPGPTGRARFDERGEGVISAAIAVLVMAGIGALMWVGFRTLWQDTEANTRDKVAEIGQ